MPWIVRLDYFGHIEKGHTECWVCIQNMKNVQLKVYKSHYLGDTRFIVILFFPTHWPDILQSNSILRYVSTPQVLKFPRTTRKTQENTAYLYWFIKGYYSGVAKWKRCIGQKVGGKGHGTSMPSLDTASSQHLSVFTNWEAPWTSSFGDFMEVSLHKHNVLNH